MVSKLVDSEIAYPSLNLSMGLRPASSSLTLPCQVLVYCLISSIEPVHLRVMFPGAPIWNQSSKKLVAHASTQS